VRVALASLRPEPVVRRWTTFWLVAAVLVIACTLVSGAVVARRVRADLAHTARASAALHAAVLRSELAKHRSLPFVLSKDPDVVALLATGSPDQAAALNRKLESLARGTGAAVIYLLDADGLTVAASNWREPTSFVGADYSFRPYFRDAKASGVAEMFALGTSSRRPGLYMSQRVDGPGGAMGVVVVKAEFQQLETDWSADSPAFATDDEGIILVTSIPQWRFASLNPLPGPEQDRLHAEQRFGRGPIRVLPSTPRLAPGDGQELVTVALPGGTPQRFLVASTRLAGGWNVFVLTPMGVTVNAAVGAAWAVTLLIGIIVCGVAAALMRWRMQASVRAARQEAARAELELRVQERTAELRSTNRRLTVEMEERRRAEAHVHRMKDQLIQSNKLATLGQIAAGVAHEINQPLAAIRSYADNTTVFLQRQDIDTALTNLGVIAGLTTRIGRITDELRAFGRMSSAPAAPVAVSEAVDGALLLLAPRIRQQAVAIDVEAATPGLQVMAERFRLEQVLVNLLQNALEALEHTPAPRISIRVAARKNQVSIVVADNGPGLSEAAAGTVFTPFATTKPRGLGLGLVICRDILSEFGGDLSLQAPTGSGASFIMTLRKAR
jgi:two-component system C4-dicarboxylate transport sensor histidine kinase DctB